eukprot:CAMPEP_0178572300 /NCGR_PEP_ID=MMETSP0697-20121206/18142_1 /TAXON_ID=265572 /ORGANISM="Extubocellulus spinifer, Strain CCMP396" /LENGTH=382 /DNA_ID=CAMNT_0020207005 /DNA_START=152 /DNA_END=1300 /DNA_ORIENTATION=+
MFSSYGFGTLYFGGGYGGRRRKASKPKKKKKENWFERLSVDQLKQLCKAAKLRHVGKKQELIDRLLDSPLTSKFGPEDKYCGINVESLKSMCRERNLQVSGAKFDLVLRILHHDNDSTPEGVTLKRAATEVATVVDAKTGEITEQHVPKKRKKAAPSASRVYTRVQKKIESVTQKKYQSHWGSKCHSSDVYELVATILLNDVVKSEAKYLDTDPRFALSIARAACTSLTDHWNTMCRMGYDDYGGWETIDSSLRTIVEAAKPVLSDEERTAAADWIEAMYDSAEPYGVVDDTDIMKTVEGLRADDEEEDERKPAAKTDEAVSSSSVVKEKEDERKPAAKTVEAVSSSSVVKEVVDERKPAAKTVEAVSSSSVVKENVENACS